MNMRDRKWFEMFYLAQAYKDHYGHLNVSRNFSTFNGIDYDADGLSLGSWIKTQRDVKNGHKSYPLRDDRERLLNSIGMIWDVPEYEWFDNYHFARRYYLDNGNLDILSDYVIDDPIKNSLADNGNLGMWIITQRQARNGTLDYTLSDEKIKLLDDIGMIWNYYSSNFSRMYKYAKEYFNEHGDLLVPDNYVCSDGVSLGSWISKQREVYNNGNLRYDREYMLETIGMIWDVKEYNWQFNFQLLEEYNEEFGNCLVSERYVTKDGIRLGRWVGRQRASYNDGSMDIRHIIMLNSIGFNWYPNKDLMLTHTITDTNKNVINELLLCKLDAVIDSVDSIDEVYDNFVYDLDRPLVYIKK